MENQESGKQESQAKGSNLPNLGMLSIPLVDVHTNMILFLQIFWIGLSLFCAYQVLLSPQILIFLLLSLSFCMNAILWFWFKWLQKCALYEICIDFQNGDLFVIQKQSNLRYDFDAKLQDFHQIQLQKQRFKHHHQNGKTSLSQRYHLILSKEKGLDFLIKSFDDEKEASKWMWQIEEKWADFRLNDQSFNDQDHMHAINHSHEIQPDNSLKPVVNTISFQKKLRLDLKIMLLILAVITCVLTPISIWIQGIEGLFLGITAMISTALFSIVYVLSRCMYDRLDKIYSEDGQLIAIDLIRIQLPNQMKRYESIFTTRLAIDCIQDYLCSPMMPLGIQVRMSYLQTKAKKKGESMDLTLINLDLMDLDVLTFIRMQQEIKAFFQF